MATRKSTKKTTGRKAAKKTATKKSSARKGVVRRAPAKAAKKASAKKALKKATAKKAVRKVAKKAAVRKVAKKAAKKTVVRKAAGRKAATRKTVARKAPAKKVAKGARKAVKKATKKVAKKVAKKTTATSVARKATARKAPAKKAAATKRRTTAVATETSMASRRATVAGATTGIPVSTVPTAKPRARGRGTSRTRKPHKITPEEALATTRQLLEAKKARDRQQPAWRQLDKTQPVTEHHEDRHTDEQAQVELKAQDLHDAESRKDAILGSIGTQDRHEQGRRDAEE